MILYHYTCRHSAEGIERDGFLSPHPQPVLAGLCLVWLTDLDHPDRAALGLTSYSLECDRTEFRVTAGTSVAVPWPAYRRACGLGRAARALETAPGALPMHWWVVAGRAPVEAVHRVA